MKKELLGNLRILVVGDVCLSSAPAWSDGLTDGFGAASALAASGRAQLEADAVQMQQAPAVAVAAKERTDLSSQFPPKKVPNQGHIGSCHIFASIAVAEAAYYRRYKVHLALSEADLFSQTQIAGGNIMNWAGPSMQANGKVQYALGEGGNPLSDVRFILKYGALPNSRDAVASYAAFSRNYKKNFEQPVSESMMKLTQLGIPAPPKVAPGQLALTAAQLEGLTPAAALMRQTVKQSFSGFKIKNQKFGKPLDYDALRAATPEQCESSSNDQREFLLDELQAGRPVLVSFEIRGIPAWRHPVGRPTDPAEDVGGHAFLITGYYTSKSGQIVFKTRNSWVKSGKSINPNIPSNQLCRVMAALSLLTPEEAASGQAVASASPAPAPATP